MGHYDRENWRLGLLGRKPMSSGRAAYICAGFYPLDADDMMHAAHLFAVWKARRKYGPPAECKLSMQTELAVTFGVSLVGT